MELGLSQGGLGNAANTAKEYGGYVLLGVALVLLATLGIPYTDSDAAQRPPPHLVMTGFLVVAVLCTVCVYMFNMSLSRFLGIVSGVFILLTIVSRIQGTAVAGSGAYAASYFLAPVAIGSLGALWPTLRDKFGVGGNSAFKDFMNRVAPVLMWGALAFGVFRGIQAMLEYRRSKMAVGQCAGAGADTRTLSSVVQPYESFQNPATADETSLQGRLTAAIQRAQQSLESIVELTDGTCAIIKETEDGYVGSKSAPPDESEYSLSKEQQESRKQARQASARKTYTSLRKVNASARGVGILECFQSTVADAVEDDETIRELCIQLAELLENAESVTQIGRIRVMEAELAFAERMLTRATEAFQDTAASPTVAPPSPAVYYTSLSGNALVAAATNLLAKESELYNNITQLQQIINRLRGQMNRVYSKAGMVATGNYDFSAGTATGTVAAPAAA